MAKQIFRSVALARMSSPDQLDQLIRVTGARMWILLLAVGLLLGTAVVWGFKGRLITKAQGKGVVVRAGNLLTVATLGQGQVVNILVKAGDTIKPGQLVAVVGQPEIADRIRAARAQLADLESEVSRQHEAVTKGVTLELEASRRQKEAIEQQIAATKQEIEDVAGQIPPYEDLLARGLVTRQQVLALKEKKASLESNVTALRSQIAQLSANDFKAESAVTQTDMQGENRLADLRRSVRLLEGQLSLSSEVRSPYSGQVVEIQSPAGTLVGPGTPILTLQPDVEEMEVVAFVSAMKAKEISTQMEAEIVPVSVRAEEHGFIRGLVRTVAEYPSTDANIMRVFQNNALAAAVAGGPVHEVRIIMLRDSSTTSGYKWSSKKGAPITVTPATICSVAVVTREEAPVSMVIPKIEYLLERMW